MRQLPFDEEHEPGHTQTTRQHHSAAQLGPKPIPHSLVFYAGRIFCPPMLPVIGKDAIRLPVIRHIPDLSKKH